MGFLWSGTLRRERRGSEKGGPVCLGAVRPRDDQLSSYERGIKSRFRERIRARPIFSALKEQLRDFRKSSGARHSHVAKGSSRGPQFEARTSSLQRLDFCVSEDGEAVLRLVLMCSEEKLRKRGPRRVLAPKVLFGDASSRFGFRGLSNPTVLRAALDIVSLGKVTCLGENWSEKKV